MNKKNGRLVLVALVLFAAVAWLGIFKNQMQDGKNYKKYLERASLFEEKKIYIDALDNYQKALEIDKNNMELALKVADMYYKLGDYNGFLSACDDAAVIDDDDPIPYALKARYFIDKANYPDAIKTLKNVPKSVAKSENIQQTIKELSTKCIEKYVSFDNVSDWHYQDDINYLAVQENEKWGMVKKDGTRKIRMQFEYLGAYDSEAGVIPCCLEGEYYYIDKQGYRKFASETEYQFLGSFGNGYAPAKRDNVYGYIDSEFEENHFEYDFAGSFANGVAAVKKNGKWALINDSFKSISGFEYDEILVDNNGYCSNFGIIVAKTGEQYMFLNLKGNKLSNIFYDGAALSAAKGELIAVQQNGKWGFASAEDGKIYIEPEFEDAKSFSHGLAPIKKNGKWGYINTEGGLVIDPQYADAGVFSEDGSAPVKNTTAWNFLVLCEYDN